MWFRQSMVNVSISLWEVMVAMGVTDSAIYMWETGVTKPRASILIKLAELYNCSVDDLLIGNPIQVQTKAEQ